MAPGYSVPKEGHEARNMLWKSQCFVYSTSDHGVERKLQCFGVKRPYGNARDQAEKYFGQMFCRALMMASGDVIFICPGVRYI